MKASEFTESKYLNAKSAGQLNGVTLTIYECKAEMIGQDDEKTRKLVAYFEGVEKGCIINATNNASIVDAFGDETDNWTGKQMILHIVMKAFKGKKVPGIDLEPVTGSHSDQDGRITQAMQENHTTSPPLGITDGETGQPLTKGKKVRK